jgi:hypothetical protein
LEKWGKKGQCEYLLTRTPGRESAPPLSQGDYSTLRYFMLWTVSCEHTAWLRRGVGCDRAFAQPQLYEPRDTGNDACAEAMLILFHGNLPSILLHHFGS